MGYYDEGEDQWWHTAIVLLLFVLYLVGWAYIVVVQQWGLTYLGFDR